MDSPTRYCDLHTHSSWSDGVEPVSQVVQNALDKGLSILALTDHDTVQGIAEARECAQGTSLEVISGVELSTAQSGYEVHILGYLFEERDPELLAALERFRNIRRDRARGILSRLEGLGMPLDEEDVFRRAKGETVGRPHIAEAMVGNGYVMSIDEAFRRFLGNNGPAWVPKPIFTPKQGIDLVSRAGGVASIAHPATIGNDALIMELAKQGLVGLECIHPKHDANTERHYRDLAREAGLTPTGGSDCHGRRPGGSMVGYGNVPAAVVDALREAAAAVRDRH